MEASNNRLSAYGRLVSFALLHDFRVRRTPNGGYGMREGRTRHDAFIGTVGECHIWLRGYARGRMPPQAKGKTS